MSENGKLLSIKEVAERLGVSRNLIWRARKDGRLKSYKVGSRVLVSPAQVKEFLVRRAAEWQARRRFGIR